MFYKKETLENSMYIFNLRFYFYIFFSPCTTNQKIFKAIIEGYVWVLFERL